MERPNLKKLLKDKEDFFVVVENDEESRQLQLIVFSCGIKWTTGADNISDIDERVFVFNDKCFSHKYSIGFYGITNTTQTPNDMIEEAEKRVGTMYSWKEDKVFKELIDTEGESSGITLRIGG